MKRILFLFIATILIVGNGQKALAQCAPSATPWKFEILNWGWTQQVFHTLTPAQVQNTASPGSVNFLNQSSLFQGGYGGMVSLDDTLCLNQDFALDVRLRNVDNQTPQTDMANDAVIQVTLANGVRLGCRLVGYAWANNNNQLYFGTSSIANRANLRLNFTEFLYLHNGFNNVRLRLQGNTLTFSQIDIWGNETRQESVTFNDPVCKTITKIEIWFKGAGEVDRVQVRDNALTTTYLDENFLSCTSYSQFPSCTEPVYNLSYVAPTCNLNRLQLNLNSTPVDSTSYSWTGPNGFTSTLKNPFINFPTSVNQGTYTVTIRPKNPCLPTYTRSINVTFPTFPTPQTFNRMICPGQTYTLPSGTVVSQAGTYNDTLASYIPGCDSIIITNLTLGNVTARTDTILCSPGIVPLQASSNGFGYLWSPSTGLSDSLIANPIANVNATTTYTVTSALPNFNAPNLVQNPGFEGGNTGFSSAYTYSNFSLTANSLYTVGANPATFWSSLAACSPHVGSNMLIFNGFSDSTYTLWCQTITVQPNTFYDMGFWAQSVRNSNANASLQFSINGTNVGPRMTIPFATCNWNSYSTYWFSGNNTSINVCIKNVSLSNDPDFALDDIWFREMCTFTDVVNVQVQQPVASISNVSNVSCFGGNNGAATASATGLSPFSYAWSNGANTAAVNNFTQGTYIVTVTDSVGCIGRDTVIITEPTQLTVSFADSVAISCFGLSDGGVRAVANGGTSPYTYSWNSTPIQNTNVLQNVAAGSYVVTVLDSNNCSATATVTISQPNQITMSFTNVTDVSCYGGNDGAAEVVGAGGSGNFTYQWEDNTTSAQNAALTGGWHSVEITDGSNCSITDSVFINQPPVFTAFVQDSVSVLCFGMNNGEFSVGVNGGSPGFTYTLNGQIQVTTNFDSLSAGSYTVIVTDANGCTATITHVVAEPDSVHASIDANPLTGLVPTTVNFNSNSTGNTNQVWVLNGAPLDSTSSYSHLFTQAGEYEVILIATNDNGCPDTTSIKIVISDSVHTIFPNVITPNGDNMNDDFDVKQSGVKSIEIVFYNRWGNVVNSNKVDNIVNPVVTLWDGTTSVGGNPCSAGTYFYDAVVEDLNGKKTKVKGTVQIFR